MKSTHTLAFLKIVNDQDLTWNPSRWRSRRSCTTFPHISNFKNPPLLCCCAPRLKNSCLLTKRIQLLLLQSSRVNNQHTSNILVCTVSFQVVFALFAVKPLWNIGVCNERTIVWNLSAVVSSFLSFAAQFFVQRHGENAWQKNGPHFFLSLNSVFLDLIHSVVVASSSF